MFQWFTTLSTREKRTFWACFSGWGLDAMDSQMYALTIPTLIALWGVSKGEAGIPGTEVLIELGYLTTQQSGVAALADVDRPGVRVGVTTQCLSRQFSVLAHYSSRHAANPDAECNNQSSV
jgi:hypothetical protein